MHGTSLACVWIWRKLTLTDESTSTASSQPHTSAQTPLAINGVSPGPRLATITRWGSDTSSNLKHRLVWDSSSDQQSANTAAGPQKRNIGPTLLNEVRLHDQAPSNQ